MFIFSNFRYTNFNLENVYDDNLFSNLNNFNIDHTITYCADNSNNKDEIISNLSKTNSTNDCSNTCFQEANIYIEDEDKCILNCKKINKYFNYNRTECIEEIPDGYFLNDSNLNTIDKCHSNCKTCNKKEEGNNNNCLECISNYTFMNDSIYNTTCYEICKVYYYYDSKNEYNCCNECPTNYKLILEKNKCIDDCNKDDIYKYEYNNRCYKSPYSSKNLMLILLFTDNYQKINDQILFYIYFIIVEDGNYPKTINFTINVSILNRLRMLDISTKKIICNYNEKNDDVLKYDCNGNVNGNIGTLTPNYDFQFDQNSTVYLSPLGNYTFYHLLNNTGPKYSSSNIMILNNSTLSQNEQAFSIKGKINNYKYDFNNVILRLYEKGTGEEKNASCITSNKDLNNYELQCKSDQTLVASINNTLGEIQNENGKYLLILINDGNNELLNISVSNGTDPESINNAYRFYKKKKGLSAGGVVAIVIPCVIALIVAIAIILKIILNKPQKIYDPNNKDNSGSKANESINVFMKN